MLSISLSSLCNYRAALLQTAAISFALGIGALGLDEAAAQSFDLPEPTPTPTPAPQGPVDVRSGVPIAPRPIPDEAPAPVPTPSPAQPVSQSTPSTAAEVETAPSPAVNAPTPLPASSQTTAPRPAAPQPQTPSSQVDQPPSGAPARNPSEQIPSSQTPAPSAINNLPPATIAPESAPAPSTTAQNGPEQPLAYWLWALIALCLAIMAGLAAIIMRYRRDKVALAAAAPRAPVARDGIALSPSPPVLKSSPAEMTARKPLKPSSPDQTTKTSLTADPAALPRLDIELDVISASRSLMMFSAECRLTIANRTDGALRDLALSGELICAQRSAATRSAEGNLSAIASIERIGPQQSHSMTMQLQLPLAEIQPMRQGQKPLFIPLLNIALQNGDAGTHRHSYILGLPSNTSAGKLHPIALDTLPGGIHGLRTREVNAGGASSKAA